MLYATTSSLIGSLVVRGMFPGSAMPISRVLVVDDEPHIRRIGELALRSVGNMEVYLASSGAEAVELAAAERPDVILLDGMMPGMDGPTTLGSLRERPETAQIPVIFMTAKVRQHEVERYLRLGAAGVIAKPFDPMRLPDDVRRICEGTS
jgi:CheY-like chemotaxis protein